MKTEIEISYLIRGAAFKIYNRLGPAYKTTLDLFEIDE
jgi:hypothetical protein